MIEEAAGTRMFEAKKEIALKTMEKKQQKVDELTRIMEQDIEPTLTQLRGDRDNYQRYITNGRELERLDRFFIALEFRNLEREVADDEVKKGEMQKRLAELRRIIKEKSDQGDLQRRLDELHSELNKELGGQLSEMKAHSDELSKGLVKSDTQLKNQREELAHETAVSVSLAKQITTTKEALSEKQSELDVVTSEYIDKEKEYAIAEESVRQHRERYQNACAGITDESNAELLSIPEQIGSWEKKAREAESQIQQNAIRMEHAKKLMKEKQKFSKAEEEEHQRHISELEVLREDVTTAEKALKDAMSKLQDEESLRRDISVYKQKCNSLKDTIEGLTAHLEARLRFEFKDPVRGFDRSKVRGMVAKLVKIRDMRNATALEVVAGGKLYQVVVDNEQTGKLLLDHGQLKKRVTILPLNKLNAKCLDAARLRCAKDIAAHLKGSAHLAIELVGFDDELTKAMEYVFGGAIVCDSSSVAKAIAFDKNVGTKTVTLDGDVYDPSGTLTGGSSSQIGTLLMKLQELYDAENSLEESSNILTSLEGKLKLAIVAGDNVQIASNKLQSSEVAFEMCKERLNESRYTRALEEQSEATRTVESLENESSNLREAYDKAKGELKLLQNAASGVTSQRDAAMKKMELATKEAQKIASSVKTLLSALRHKKDGLEMEIESLSKEITSLEEQKLSCDQGLEKMSRDVEALMSDFSSRKQEYDTLKASIDACQKELSKCSSEIKRLELEKEAYARAVEAANIEHKSITNDLNEWDRRIKDSSDKLSSLLKKWPWIETERAHFGEVDGEYDFDSRDIDALNQRKTTLQGDQVRYG